MPHIPHMRKRSGKLRKDENEIAFDTVRAMIGEGPRPEAPDAREKNPEAVRRGRKGGKAGGRARAEKLTPAERAKIASQAARARWEKRDDVSHTGEG
jgi:hypothetical protein